MDVGACDAAGTGCVNADDGTDCGVGAGAAFDAMWFVECEFATAAAYRIGGNGGFAVVGAGPFDDGSPDFNANDMGWFAKFGAGTIFGTSEAIDCSR